MSCNLDMKRRCWQVLECPGERLFTIGVHCTLTRVGPPCSECWTIKCPAQWMFWKRIGSAVLDEEAKMSPAVSKGPLERPTQTAGCAADSLVTRIGQSVVHRSGPRRVADTRQLQALLEVLADPSATISEGDGNVEEDRAVLCLHCVSCFGTKDCLPKGVQNFF